MAASTFQTNPFDLHKLLEDCHGDAWEHEANRAKLVRWYWNGVFGEFYGSAVETRIARDFIEVPVWLKGGPEPSTVMKRCSGNVQQTKQQQTKQQQTKQQQTKQQRNRKRIQSSLPF